MDEVTDLSGTDISGTEIPIIDYLFDINQLVTEHDLLLRKEAADRAIVDTIEFPDTVNLKAKLVEWANNGFADAFTIFSITVTPPPVCSDGVTRKLFEYIAYLAGVPIAEKMARLSAKLKGMHVECSYSGETITFHVFKDSPSYTGGYSVDTTQVPTSTPDTLPPPDAPAE